MPVISPDGSRVAYSTGGSLWVRELDRFEARELPDTDGARYLLLVPGQSTPGLRTAGASLENSRGGRPAERARCGARGPGGIGPRCLDPRRQDCLLGQRHRRTVGAPGGGRRGTRYPDHRPSVGGRLPRAGPAAREAGDTLHPARTVRHHVHRTPGGRDAPRAHRPHRGRPPLPDLLADRPPGLFENDDQSRHLGGPLLPGTAGDHGCPVPRRARWPGAQLRPGRNPVLRPVRAEPAGARPCGP